MKCALRPRMFVYVGRFWQNVCVGMCWPEFVLVGISGKMPEFWCNSLCNPRL